MYRCPVHNTDQDSYCDGCMADFASRRHPHEMTGDERADALMNLCRVVTMPMDNIHQRIQELVGRPVYTHEMAGEERFAQLVEEARTNDHPSFKEITDKLPADKPVFIISAEPRTD